MININYNYEVQLITFLEKYLREKNIHYKPNIIKVIKKKNNNYIVDVIMSHISKNDDHKTNTIKDLFVYFVDDKLRLINFGDPFEDNFNNINEFFEYNIQFIQNNNLDNINKEKMNNGMIII